MRLAVYALSLAAVVAIGLSAMAAPVAMSGTYSQNFDGMGTGTAYPAGWAVYSISGSHDQFVPATPPTGNDIKAGSAVTMVAVTGPTNQKASNGYNFGLSASSGDRALGTSPTGTAGMVLELQLTNGLPYQLTGFTINYDIRRFSTTTNNNTGYDGDSYKGIEELPGYRLFYSVDGGSTYTNVSALNPTISGPTGVIMPNATGVTSVPQTEITFTSPLAANGSLKLRWFDDNAQSPSPDQLIGLDNVTVTPVPEPATLTVVALGGLTLLRRKSVR